MDSLSELINIVNKKRLSKIDVLDKTFLNSKNDNLYFKLYNAISTKQVINDDDASFLLYGANKSDPRYKMLKSRFKSKLFKSILLFDSENVSNSDVIKAYYECLTYNQTVEIIIKLTGTTKLVFELIKDDYSKALKYNFYDILRNYSYYLLCFYSLKGDTKSFNIEETKYLNYIQLAQKEQYAKYIYYKVIKDFVSGLPITNELMNSVNENLNILLKYRRELDSIEVDFFYFYLALLYYENINDLNGILNICDEANELMNCKPHSITNTRQTAILQYKLKVFLNSRKFEDGIIFLNSTNNILIPESNYNWFIIKETEFKLYLQDKKLPEAYEVYEKVLANKSFKRQAGQLTEKWKIYHAYWVFMDSYLNNGDYKFSISKFLNEVPINTKDKSGYNFAIRIIEMLFQMALKDYNLLFSKMDALRIYRSRYLNDNTYKRNHLFLSLLLKSEKSGFLGKEMQNAKWKEIAELRKQNNYIIADWEIIPYEELWDIFVEMAK